MHIVDLKGLFDSPKCHKRICRPSCWRYSSGIPYSMSLESSQNTKRAQFAKIFRCDWTSFQHAWKYLKIVQLWLKFAWFFLHNETSIHQWEFASIRLLQIIIFNLPFPIELDLLNDFVRLNCKNTIGWRHFHFLHFLLSLFTKLNVNFSLFLLTLLFFELAKYFLTS